MSHGGKRLGAGRPKGSNSWGESTKAIRVPQSRVEDIKAFLEGGLNYTLPLYSCKVRAGFPSPADDYIESRLDLNEHLIKHPAATFFVIASGDSIFNHHITDYKLNKAMDYQINIYNQFELPKSWGTGETELTLYCKRSFSSESRPTLKFR
ncbi:S24 family peptidase [Legionella feeleii]|uniref:SOS (Error prone) mutagenesis protein UmuD (RumA) n=1 Tax=Legionella feeleii TaxID=453 RepID=A0A0W0TWZ0_9GAMM|nr:hypothetical protein [Legionella feeleii]KTD00190.1 SOS error prone mutagenesis protein UmuD (RumA) [Legionella feeleii]SPX60092.1 SOS (error prone) mutagenesis protein UmuD (RumA) [Legionella feeleii]